jgi:hypothetical protein
MLTLGAPQVGVEETTKLKFALTLKEIVTVEAGAEGTLSREVTGTAHAPVMPRTAPTSGTEVPIHSADAGYFHAVRQIDALGKATLTNPVVALKMDYDALARIIEGKGSSVEHNAAIDKVMDNLIDDLGAKAKTQGLEGTFDRAKCVEAFKQAILVAASDYRALQSGRDKSNFRVPFEDFAVRVNKKTYKPMAHKVMFEFRLEKDASGALALKPPLDSQSTADVLRARDDYAVALTRRKAAEVAPTLNVRVKHEGFMQARLDHEGVRVPVIGLQDKMVDVFAAFDETPVQPRGSSATVAADPEHGIKKWADKMVTRIKTKLLKPAADKGQFTGRFDEDQVRETLIDAGRSLQGMKADVTRLGSKAKMVRLGNGMEIRIDPREGSSGHKLTLQFQAVQQAEDPTQWKLPPGVVATSTPHVPSEAVALP